MVKTGPSGAFALRSVPTDDYDLIVEIPGEARFTIPDVEVYAGAVTELGTIYYCSEPLTFSEAYYTAYDSGDSGGQAALANFRSILVDGTANTGRTDLGFNYYHSIGGEFEGPQSVSKIRMYGDGDDWSNFKVLYNTANSAYGWTEVTGLTVTKDREPGGLDGKLTNELSFDPVSARYWKVWGAASDSTGVISVYELEAWGSQF